MRVIRTDAPFEFASKFEQELVYNALDAAMTREVYNALLPQLRGGLEDVYRFERLLLGPVMAMMRRGVKLDTNKISDLTARLETQYKNLGDTFDRFVAAVFDVDPNVDKKGKVTKSRFFNSPVKLSKLFFDWLQIPKGNNSTDRESLERMEKGYVRARPFTKLLLKLRDIKGQLDVLKTKQAPGGRLAGSYNIGGTESSRFSSSEHPMRHSRNMQNLDPDLRSICVADPGRTFINIDLKRAEAVGVAFLSGDENYIAAVYGPDVHTFVAHKAFGIENTREASEKEYIAGFSYRDMAKRCTHGTSYLGTARTLASILRLRTNIMEQFQHFFFKAFPGIKQWHAKVALEVQQYGYRISPTGRRRHFWDRSWDESTWREAVANDPQSLISDVNKLGLYLVWYHFEPHVWVHAEGHDSILLSVPKGEEDKWLKKILEVLNFQLMVNGRPMLIEKEVKIGWNLGEQWTEKKNAKLSAEGKKPKPLNPDGLREKTT